MTRPEICLQEGSNHQHTPDQGTTGRGTGMTYEHDTFTGQDAEADKAKLAAHIGNQGVILLSEEVERLKRTIRLQRAALEAARNLIDDCLGAIGR